MTEVIKLDNIFTEQELEEISALYESNVEKNSELFTELGRLHVLLYGFPQRLADKLTDLVTERLGLDSPLELVLAPNAAEYSSKYGSPQLSPHYDGDWTDVIIDFQLSSNTSWPIGVELEAHTLQDNSGVMFNPNKGMHWRPQKDFKPGEYVRMVFFRFKDPVNPTNNDGKQIAKPDNEHFQAVAAYANSLR
jgi:hypothetical protein